MIIQCEQCQTKFRLDDSKVTDKGVKVRCAKCKHVFTVKSEQPEPEVQSDFGVMLDQNVSFGSEEAVPSVPGTESPTPESQSGPSFDYSDFIAEDFSLQGERSTGETSLSSNDEPAAPLDQPAVPGDGFGASAGEQSSPFAPAGDEFSLSSLDGELGFAVESDEKQAETGGADFGGFDFGGGAADADKTVVASAPIPSFTNMDMAPTPDTGPAAAETDDSSPFDFVDEPAFGDVISAPAEGMPEEQSLFDAQIRGFDDASGADFSNLETPQAVVAENKVDDTFSMGDIDFGGASATPALQQAQPEEPEPRQEQSAPPVMAVQEAPEPFAGHAAIKGPDKEALQVPQEEQPPLSIPSRRKHNPVISILIAVATVVVVAVLGFFGYTMFSEDKGKVVVEAGRITVRSVDASFVKNPAAGDLLVITGEAVNAFTKPRAAIQIKGMVYGANGQVLASKNAYCGNPLTKAQLTEMPLDKIEAVMANQFGDSLSNLEVAPGKAIPFVIVIAKPPADAKDFGVVPAGSTVATGKQQ